MHSIDGLSGTKWEILLFHSMLLGQFEGKLDHKSRIAFPKKFREVIGRNIILTKGIDQNLIAVSQKNWETLLEGTSQKPFLDASTRQMQRYLLGNAFYVELDDKSRFLLPEYLREYAKLGTDIIFVGINRYVEIWDKVRWEKEQKDLELAIPSIAKQLTEGLGDE